jgi:internalin A
MNKIFVLVGLVVSSSFAVMLPPEELDVGSREGDSLALVAIKEANLESDLDWDFGKPLEQWDSVTLVDNRVTQLRLSRKLISNICPEIGNMTDLEVLILSRNRISTLPAEIGNLTNLAILNLEYNVINSLPESITAINFSDVSYNNETVAEYPLGFNYNSLDISTVSLDVFLWIDNHSNPDWRFQQSGPVDIVGDSLALLEILEANPESSLDWDITTDFRTWGAVEWDPEVGITHGLYLYETGITTLPESISQFANLSTLNINTNNLVQLPERIILLAPTRGLDVSYNYLNEDNMTVEMISWLDKYDPDWRDTQKISSPIRALIQLTPKQLTLSTSNKTLNFSTPLPSSTNLSIFTLNGKEILKRSVSGSSINIPSLSQGVYMVRIDSESLNSVFKVSVK